MIHERIWTLASVESAQALTGRHACFDAHRLWLLVRIASGQVIVNGMSAASPSFLHSLEASSTLEGRIDFGVGGTRDSCAHVCVWSVVRSCASCQVALCSGVNCELSPTQSTSHTSHTAPNAYHASSATLSAHSTTDSKLARSFTK